MIRRFKIEDLIVQDSSGVVFRALDTETGKTVAVRRFFPFGVDGGGLHADEQTAYDIAISRLAGISHPALRSVICGGCDPVDGMPFIATEWVEGHSLLPVTEQGPLPAESATELITNALEVCELLSQVLAEEAVWVETDVQTIVIGDENSGRRFTFWISPLKWLGSGDEPRGLESIVNLTEEIMGWRGKAVNDQAGRGLGGWLNWLRRAAATTTLHEARESLAASIGAEPPASAKKLVTRAAVPTKPLRPARPIKRSKPKTLLIVNIVLVLILAGLGGWMWIRKNPDSSLAQLLYPKQSAALEAVPESEVVAATADTKAEPAPLPPTPEPSLSGEERILRAIQQAKDGIIQDQPKPAPEPRNKPAPEPVPAPVIQWNDYEVLLASDHKDVVVEGVFEKIGYSKERNTMYLQFTKTPKTNTPQGTILLKDAPADLAEAELNKLIGKTIRLRGKVEVQKAFGLMRPDIRIKSRDCIKVLP